jgi:hypothetical protein
VSTVDRTAERSAGRRPVDWLLAVAVLAAPLAWGGQLVVGWGLDELGCGRGVRPRGEIYGVGIGVIQVVVSMLAGLAALAGVAAAVRWRRHPDRADDARGERRRTAAMVGLGVSILFTALVVLGGLQLLVLDTCD